MSGLLTPLFKEGWLKNFLDDVILWADNFQQLMQRLQRLLPVREEREEVTSKCDFAKEEVFKAGHTLDPKILKDSVNRNRPQM